MSLYSESNQTQTKEVNEMVTCTATGIRVDNSKVITSRSEVAAAIAPLSKSEKRHIRRELHSQPRTRKAGLHLAGIVN